MFDDTEFGRLARQMSWRFAVGSPYANYVITNINTRDPHEVMEELREHDPDAHANLSEHIVLPPRNRPAS